MIKTIVLFASAFALCAAIGSASTGCYMGDCDCPPVPDFPSDKPAKPATIGFGAEPTPPAAPENVTLEVKGNNMIVRYVESGANIDVLYGIDR